MNKKLKMIVGTEYFSCLTSAYNYYSRFGFTRVDVLNKFKNKEFKTGLPEIKENEKLVLNKDEGRYMIYVYEKEGV